MLLHCEDGRVGEVGEGRLGRLPGCQLVVGSNDLEVKPGADPHGVGVDQLLGHEGAHPLRRGVGADILISGYLLDQLNEGLGDGEPARHVARLTTSRAVQVVQAVAPLSVLGDGRDYSGHMGE